MNSTHALILEELAQNDTILPGVLARNMLIAAGQLDYMEKLVFPEDSLKSTLADEENDNNPYSDKQDKSWIRVYPNPAKDYYVIEYILRATENDNNRTIEIFNIQGELMEEIPLSKLYDQIVKRCEHYPPGVFICVLKDSYKQISSVSFIITR